MRRFAANLALLFGLAGVVAGGPPDRWQMEKFDELQLEYRRSGGAHRLSSVRREERERILQAVVDLNFDEALKWAIAQARDCGDEELQRSMMKYLERKRPDSPLVIALFRDIVTQGGGNRVRARDFLLEWAVRENQQPWLLRLFQTGSAQDQFHAVRALGLVASGATIEYAQRLLDDDGWEPEPRGIVCAGTLAGALQAFEGEDAARFLLLLQQDPRFRESDAEAVRHATRLWKHADLKRYVSLRALGDPDDARRAGVARFMGRAGIETARAALLARALDPSEVEAVRAAAIGALGHLRLARGALARDLAQLVREEDDSVRRAAYDALARLRVRQGAETLVERLGSSDAAYIRTALAAHNELPADTDWAAWLNDASCPLPEGT